MIHIIKLKNIRKNIYKKNIYRLYYIMEKKEESKLYSRTESLLSFLSYNNFIDDTTFQEILHTLDIIKNSNDKDGEYIYI